MYTVFKRHDGHTCKMQLHVQSIVMMSGWLEVKTAVDYASWWAGATMLPCIPDVETARTINLNYCGALVESCDHSFLYLYYYETWFHLEHIYIALILTSCGGLLWGYFVGVERH